MAEPPLDSCIKIESNARDFTHVPMTILQTPHSSTESDASAAKKPKDKELPTMAEYVGGILRKGLAKIVPQRPIFDNGSNGFSALRPGDHIALNVIGYDYFDIMHLGNEKRKLANGRAIVSFRGHMKSTDGAHGIDGYVTVPIGDGQNIQIYAPESESEGRKEPRLERVLFLF